VERGVEGLKNYEKRIKVNNRKDISKMGVVK